MQRAFMRSGHDVKTVGPTTGNEIWGMHVDDKYAWKADAWLGPYNIPADGLWDMNVLGVGSFGEWQPDLIINADSAFALSGNAPCDVVLWGVDNHVRDYKLREWSMMFLAHSWGQRMTEPNAFWLPCAYDPELHFDKGVDRDIDVAIVGVPYPERVEITQKMSAAGLKVAACMGLLFEEYNDLYNRAKIALVKSIAGDLPQRTFENMAQGCCVLTDYTPDLMKLKFEPFNDVWIYNGVEDAVDAAQWLISSGDWRKIAQSGAAQVKPHTWDARAQQLINVWEASREP